MESIASEIRSVFIQMWHEYAVYNTRDVYGSEVVAQGQISGKYYVLTLDDDGRVIDAELYH